MIVCLSAELLGFSTVTGLMIFVLTLLPFTYAVLPSTNTTSLSLPNVVAAEVFPASPSEIICAVVLYPLFVLSFKYSLMVI